MTPLLLGAAGMLALVLGGLVLRTFGGAYRIGRLLSTTPAATVGEAIAIAAAGERRYVRVSGRIDADDEFEDEAHRPLVFRRTRLEARQGRRWVPFEDHRQSVPFTINEGLDTIGVDVEALGEGLVVVPRESAGSAADLIERAPAGLAPETPVRARIEQISSVEHAIVIGYPIATDAPVANQRPAIESPGADEPASEPTKAPVGPAGPRQPGAELTAGRGRPLILTVLEPDEAMRILAGGDAGRTRLAAGLLGAGVILVLGAVAWAAISALLPAVVAAIPGLVPTALAASTEPTPVAGGDPRSNGQGPGLVGTPGLALLGVLTIAAIAVVVTTVYVRLTAPPAERPRASARRERR